MSRRRIVMNGADEVGAADISKVPRTDAEQSGDRLARVLGIHEEAALTSQRRTAMRFHMETMFVSEDGAVFLVGWADDRHDKIHSVECRSGDGSVDFGPSACAREAREDVTLMVGGNADALGFWCFATSTGFSLSDQGLVTVRLLTAAGRAATQTIRAFAASRASFRTTLLTYDLTRPRLAQTPLEETCRAEAAKYIRSGDADTKDDGVAAVRISGFDATDSAVGSQILHLHGPSRAIANAAHAGPRCSIDAVFANPNGAILLIGWINDAHSQMDSVRVTGDGWEAYVPGAATGRARRTDVEEELGTSNSHAYGFWSLITGQEAISLPSRLRVELALLNGAKTSTDAPPVQVVSATQLRDTTLSYFAGCCYHGAPHVEAQAQLDGDLGRRIIALNRAVSRQLTAKPYIQRFAGSTGQLQASLIVCLYGRSEFLFLQAAAFSRLPNFVADYEIVYVSNSPELSERLTNEAQIAHRVFGVDITLVLLAGNAGFGAANNAAAQHCRSNRLVFTNPDVFPDGSNWARRHLALIDERPPTETRLFGVPLYYDDGSMMHAGMYFEMESGLSWTQFGVASRPMLRVEHYAKGAPPRTARYLMSRPVPAVTGAFISAQRLWFEALGGFTEDYVFGHYEDADLCLKSLQRGTPAWLHDVGLLHLEGKGSVRNAEHEGGSIVNRWLFSRTWLDTISDGMLGPAPDRMAVPAPTDTLRVAAAEPVAIETPAIPIARSRSRKRARAANTGAAWQETAAEALG